MSAWGQNAPLPPGWEAKYDQGSGRYFFINHSTRETTWNDPRVAYQQPYYQQQPQQQYGGYTQQYQQQQAQPQSSSAAEALSNNGDEETSNFTQSIQMNSLGLMESENEEDSETGLTEPTLMGDLVSDAEKQAKLRQIKGEMDLIGVADDLILTTLDASGFDVEMTISMFQSMGFKKKGDAGTTQSDDERKEREAEKKRREEAEKRRKDVEKKRREEAEKRRKEQQERRRKEEEERKQRELEEKKRQREAMASSVTQTVDADKIQNMFDTALMDLDKMMSKKSTQRPGASSTSNSSSFLDALKAKASKPHKTQAKGKQPRKAAAKKSQNEPLKAKLGSDGLLVKLKPEGPDPSLVNGSSASELRTSRMNTQGRDRTLVSGRQRGLAKGRSSDLAAGRTCHAMGSDSSLRVGPNPGLVQGPNRGISV